MFKYRKVDSVAEVFDYCQIVDPGYLPEAGRIIRAGTYDHPGSQNAAILVNYDGSVAAWNFENPELRAYYAPIRERTEGRRNKTAPVENCEAKKEEPVQKQAALYASTARKSYRFYRSLDGCFPTNHPYLKAKKVKATSGMRQCTCEQFEQFFHTKIDLIGPLLVIPLTDGQKTQSLQLIDTQGNKRFLTHGKKKGCYWLARWIPEEPKRIALAEGVATALSIKDYLEKIDPGTSTVVLAAMDCGNLTEAAKSAQKKYGQAEICIFADNDRNGAGLTAAMEAAKSLAGDVKVYYPEFTRLEIDVFREKCHDALKTPTDFNDKALIGLEKLFSLDHPYSSNKSRTVQKGDCALVSLCRKFCRPEEAETNLPESRPHKTGRER